MTLSPSFSKFHPLAALKAGVEEEEAAEEAMVGGMTIIQTGIAFSILIKAHYFFPCFPID